MRRRGVCWFWRASILCWIALAGFAMPSLVPLARAAEGAWQNVRPSIVPMPKEYRASGQVFAMDMKAAVAVSAPQRPTIQIAAELVTEWFRKNGFSTADIVAAGQQPEAGLLVVLQSSPDSQAAGSQAPGGYRIRVIPPTAEEARPTVTISGADDVGVLYGCYTFLKSLEKTGSGLRIRQIEVDDEPALQVRGLSPQWAWYLGQRGPYGAALWRLREWKRLLDFMAEYRLNMLALCTYGTFPMRLEKYEAYCSVNLPFKLWDPEKGVHTLRWTHPAYEDDFLNALADYAHARGIRVLIYLCMNLQDDAGSQQWANEKELKTYCDILQQIVRRYRVDGFIFESGEYYLRHSDDLARFGQDQWSRMKADLFLTHLYDRTIRAVKPDALVGLVDHYLFRDWEEKGVPQRDGLRRWLSELPPRTINAFVASPEAYDVFPPERVWTYLYGPKGGLKPAIQVHLADCCDVPRAKGAGGAYYVTYDFSPHEIDYLCFAESAWGNYGGPDERGFIIHSSESGVGGPISGRAWDNIVREFYGEGCGFGEGLLTASKATWQDFWDVEALLHRRLAETVVRPLEHGDLDAAQRAIDAIKSQEALTEEGLHRMRAQQRRGASAMVTEYPIDEHFQKAIQLARVQRSWLRFVRAVYETAVLLARHCDQPQRCSEVIEALRAGGRAEHAEIRDAMDKAYFHYPHDKLAKLEFVADPRSVTGALAEFALRARLRAGPEGKRYKLTSVAEKCRASADSNYAPSHYGPQYTIDGRRGSASRGVWVSAETADPHWLEIELPEPQPVRGLVVRWVRDSTHDWVPRAYEIQILAGDAWQSVSSAEENTEPVAIATLEPPADAGKVRIRITLGSPSRPRLGAVAEVEVFAVDH